MTLFRIFLLVVLLPLSAGCQNAEPEIYLIPESFNGEVFIFFEQNGESRSFKNMRGKPSTYTEKLGEPRKYENGRRVYEIPASGFLLTQFSNNDGFIDREYYSVDAKGKRTRLEVFKFEHFKKDSAGYIVSNPNARGIFGDGTAGVIGNENVVYQSFTVSDYAHLKKYENEFQIEELFKKVEDTLNIPN